MADKEINYVQKLWMHRSDAFGIYLLYRRTMLGSGSASEKETVLQGIADSLEVLAKDIKTIPGRSVIHEHVQVISTSLGKDFKTGLSCVSAACLNFASLLLMFEGWAKEAEMELIA